VTWATSAPARAAIQQLMSVAVEREFCAGQLITLFG